MLQFPAALSDLLFVVLDSLRYVKSFFFLFFLTQFLKCIYNIFLNFKL